MRRSTETNSLGKIVQKSTLVRRPSVSGRAYEYTRLRRPSVSGSAYKLRDAVRRPSVSGSSSRKLRQYGDQQSREERTNRREYGDHQSRDVRLNCFPFGEYLSGLLSGITLVASTVTHRSHRKCRCILSGLTLRLQCSRRWSVISTTNTSRRRIDPDRSTYSHILRVSSRLGLGSLGPRITASGSLVGY